MKLLIEKNKSSFLPEVEAYENYFIDCGFDVTVAEERRCDPSDYDVIFLFHGFHPFWKKCSKLVVGEYHSLSTGKGGRLKDIVKRCFNVRADVNIFLNDRVRSCLLFSKSDSHVYRGMGYHEQYIKRECEKVYDVVYSGSIRSGVEPVLIKLAEAGLTIVVAGNEDPILHDNITCYGKVEVGKSYEVMSQARYGLNITPDVFPWNVQDSTKVIEYCALGLGVITNKYEWVCGFESRRGGVFIDIEDVRSKADLEAMDYLVPDVSDLGWSKVMKDTDLASRLLDMHYVRSA